MRDSVGRVALNLRPAGCRPQKVGQWLRSRPDWISYRWGNRWFEALWNPWRGLLAVGSGAVGSHLIDRKYLDPHEVMMGIKKRDVSSGPNGARPPLPAESVAFKKFPTLCEWLTATAYEDGSPRTPGYMWLSNRVIGFEVTIFDPDGCAKLPCLGRTLDEALALAETHLRADEAPWQQDNFLLSKRQEKKKK